MVQIKNTPHLQIARSTRTQDITENIPLTDANAALGELLALPFAQIHVQNSRRRPAHSHHKKRARTIQTRKTLASKHPTLSLAQPRQTPSSIRQPSRHLSTGPRHHGSQRARTRIHARQIQTNQRLSPPLTTRHTRNKSPPHPHRLRVRQRVSHIRSVSLPEQHTEHPRATHRH